MISTREQWDNIYRFVGMLDRKNGRGTGELQTRLMKLTEENGEVSQAYFGMMGINPRKGVTHTLDDLCDELADVMLAAAIALATFAEEDPAGIVERKMAKLMKRIDAAVPAPTSPRG